MNSVEQISEFMEKLFDLYHAVRVDFFSEYDDETDEMIDRPLFWDEEVDNYTLNKLAIHFGMDKEEILNMDLDAALRYWKKYPFFHLYNDYLDHWAYYARFKGKKPTAEEYLINAIFSDEQAIRVEEKYNYNIIKKRMVAKLKEIDRFLPGTYHQGANITKLRIETEVFFSFPKCSEMIRSFVSMVNRVKELFFKAIQTDLMNDEIKELNFLASWLRAGDAVMPSVLITYDNVRLYRKAYVDENLTDFYSYVKIRRFSYGPSLWPSYDFIPWRCQEFFDDMGVVQEFADIFPATKVALKEFAMKITNFYCIFTWSDAEPVRLSDEDEQLVNDYNDIMGIEDIPAEERARVKTEIYVEKTEDEMPGWNKYVKRLITAASPEVQGGLKPTFRNMELVSGPTSVKRIIARMNCK